LHCTLNGVVIGLISFLEFLCEISIQYMTVNEAFRRQGYARSMLLFLQDSYPENEIFFGQLTDDGAALVAS